MISLNLWLLYFFLVKVFSVENCSLKVSELTKKAFPKQENIDFTEYYDIIELENITNAKCLDGSNYKFFFTQGHGSGTNKWMVFWQAAYFCGGEGMEIMESCYQRTWNKFGTSKNDGENGTKFAITEPLGYFSNNEIYNELFWNYNKIYLRYCDGSLHQGFLKDPILHSDTYLYFRGFQNTYAALQHAINYLGMDKAIEVVLTGTSSGGMALFFWAPYIKNIFFDENVKIWAINDAGLLLDLYNDEFDCYPLRYELQKLTNLTNSTNMPLFENCIYNPDDIWKCLAPQYNYVNITVPVFIMQDQADYCQLTSINSIECVADGGPAHCKDDDRAKIDKIRMFFLKVIFTDMMPKKPQWGFWLRSCFEHTLAGTWAWYGHNYTAFNAEMYVSWNLKDSLAYWYNGGKFREINKAHFIDFIDWEHNPECEINGIL